MVLFSLKSDILGLSKARGIANKKFEQANLAVTFRIMDNIKDG